MGRGAEAFGIGGDLRVGNLFSQGLAADVSFGIDVFYGFLFGSWLMKVPSCDASVCPEMYRAYCTIGSFSPGLTRNRLINMLFIVVPCLGHQLHNYQKEMRLLVS